MTWEGRVRKEAHKRCGCSSMVERQLPKLHTGVRFPSSAPMFPKNNMVFVVRVAPSLSFVRLKPGERVFTRSVR